MVSNSPSYKPCHCRRTGCFKLYCDCLRAGLLCSDKCKCTGCKNRVPNEQREKLLNLVKAKVDFSSPSPHHGTSLTPTRGCHCKKSGCLKNYCECFQNGQPCSTRCACAGCKNTNMSYIMGRRSKQQSSGGKNKAGATEGSNSTSGENAFTPGKMTGAINSTPSKHSQTTPAAFAKLADSSNVADYGELDYQQNFDGADQPNTDICEQQFTGTNDFQLGLNGQQSMMVNTNNEVNNNLQQRQHQIEAADSGAFQTPVKRAFQKSSNSKNGKTQLSNESQSKSLALRNDATFMADKDSSGEMMMTMKDETATFQVKQKSGSGAQHDQTSQEGGMDQQQQQETIVVHDRFLTGSGEFVDASMLRGPAQDGPPAHSPQVLELQDSEMVVYDNDDDGDAVLESAKKNETDDADGGGQVMEVPEASLKKQVGINSSPVAAQKSGDAPASKSSKKQQSSSANEEEKAAGRDAGAKQQDAPASGAQRTGTRTPSKSQSKKGSQNQAASQSQKSAAKPSQVRTRAQKCKKTDSAAKTQ